MTLKEQVLFRYKQLVQDKIDVFQDMITNLATDAQNDAKGSAGDKHETALSMMHIEQEKLTQKLREILEQKEILNQIDPQTNNKKIALGSLVKVNEMWLFLSSALPKTEIEGKTFFALSTQSPLGSKLMGKEVGNSVEINGKIYEVVEVI